MNRSGVFVKALVFAAYLLAILVLVVSMGREQTPVEHARMMAMAGHAMNMADMGSSEPDRTMLLCQQDCLVVVAALLAVVTGDDPLVSSLAFPPPGHPPKAAVI